MQKWVRWIGCSACALSIAGLVNAQERTENHEYDSLGRLIITQSSGVGSTETRSYCFDELGSRSVLRTSTDGSVANCPPPLPAPTPSPTPAPTNTPPVANGDLARGWCNTSTTFNVTANDSDAEDDPAKPVLMGIVEASGGGASAARLNGSSVSIDFGSAAGISQYTYTIKDSAGATDTAFLTIETMCFGGSPDQ